MNDTLRKQFEYFLKNQSELVKLYNGKVVVIHDEQVDGVYDSELEAVTDAAKKYAMGTFLVQRVEPGHDAYTQVFHSRVAFA